MKYLHLKHQERVPIACEGEGGEGGDEDSHRFFLPPFFPATKEDSWAAKWSSSRTIKEDIWGDPVVLMFLSVLLSVLLHGSFWDSSLPHDLYHQREDQEGAEDIPVLHLLPVWPNPGYPGVQDLKMRDQALWLCPLKVSPLSGLLGAVCATMWSHSIVPRVCPQTLHLKLLGRN